MNFLFVFFSIIFLIFFFLLVANLTLFKIKITYIREDGVDNISLIFSILSIKLEYEIFIPSTWSLLNRKVKIYRVYKQKGKKILVDTDRLVEKYTDIRKSSKITYPFINRVYRYLIDSRRLKIEVFNLLVTIGLNDAFWTGITTGTAWGILGSAYSFLSNNYSMIEKSLIIKTNYLKRVSDIDFLCIISLKNVHIITVGIIYITFRIRNRIYIRW